MICPKPHDAFQSPPGKEEGVQVPGSFTQKLRLQISFKVKSALPLGDHLPPHKTSKYFQFVLCHTVINVYKWFVFHTQMHRHNSVKRPNEIFIIIYLIIIKTLEIENKTKIIELNIVNFLYI